MMNMMKNVKKSIKEMLIRRKGRDNWKRRNVNRTMTMMKMKISKRKYKKMLLSLIPQKSNSRLS